MIRHQRLLSKILPVHHEQLSNTAYTLQTGSCDSCEALHDLCPLILYIECKRKRSKGQRRQPGTAWDKPGKLASQASDIYRQLKVLLGDTL